MAKVGWWNTRRMLDLASRRRSRATAATITINHFWADRGILCFWIFAALALAGAFTAMARRTPWYVWAMPILMFFSVVFLVVETPRYRTPIDPFIVLLATAALVTAARRVLAQRSIGPLVVTHEEGHRAADACGLTGSASAATLRGPAAGGDEVDSVLGQGARADPYHEWREFGGMSAVETRCVPGVAPSSNSALWGRVRCEVAPALKV